MSDEMKLVIVSSPVGLVIGNMRNNTEDEMIVNQPRVLMTTQVKEGMQITLLVLLGMPSEIVLPNTCWWEVRDTEMKKRYLEAITGLTLVTSLPGGSKLPPGKMN